MTHNLDWAEETELAKETEEWLVRWKEKWVGYVTGAQCEMGVDTVPHDERPNQNY